MSRELALICSFQNMLSLWLIHKKPSGDTLEPYVKVFSVLVSIFA